MNTRAIQTNIVGLKELRLNIEKYIKLVQKGYSFTVVRKSTPVFKVEPVDRWGDEGTWEPVVDFTTIKKGGVPAVEVLKALRSMK